MPEFIDPFAGGLKGIQVFNQLRDERIEQERAARNDAFNQDRQLRIDDLNARKANQEFTLNDMKLREAQRNEENVLGLSALNTRINAGRPVSKDASMPYREGMPESLVDRVPYTEKEAELERQKYYREKGMTAQLKDSVDITDKIDARTKQQFDIMMSHLALDPSGTTLKALAQQMGMDPSAVDNIKQGEGGITEITLGNGRVMTVYPTEQGLKFVLNAGKGSGGAGESGDEEEASYWVDAVRSGRANLSDVPSRGKIRTHVIKAIESTTEGGDKVDYAANTAENKAMASSISQQEKNLGSLKPFLTNIDGQIKRFDALSQKLNTFDTRALNIPLRAIRGKIVGSPLQAELDTIIKEISTELTKVASGSTGSVQQAAEGARQEWEAIHDKNLSMADMRQLLSGFKDLAAIRLQSVEQGLAETKARMRDRGKKPAEATPKDSSPPGPPKAGYKWQRNKTTGEYRQVPL